MRSMSRQSPTAIDRGRAIINQTREAITITAIRKETKDEGEFRFRPEVEAFFEGMVHFRRWTRP